MNIHCSTVYNSKDLEPTQMFIKNRMDKKNVAHIHHEILRSHKSDFMPFIGTWMNLETIILSKLTQEQKTKHCMLSLRWVLNNWNMWTQGGEHHTLQSVGEARRGTGDREGGEG